MREKVKRAKITENWNYIIKNCENPLKPKKKFHRQWDLNLRPTRDTTRSIDLFEFSGFFSSQVF